MPDPTPRPRGAEVDFDPFRGDAILRSAPTTEPQREVISSASLGDDANRAFNEAVSLRLTGALSADAVEQALRTIVDRHEMLRSTFTRGLDEFVVGAGSRFVLSRGDLTGLDQAAQEDRLQELWRHQVGQPLDLHEGPLFLAFWTQLAPERAELTLLAHHAVCDGWSFHLILSELAVLLAGDGAAVLPPAPSFAEFAELQQARAQANADVDHWVARFAGAVPTLDLPTVRPRPPRRTFAARRTDHSVHGDVVRALTATAGRLKASVVNFTLAATAVLLHRLSGADDLVVGLPLARQGVDGHPRLVGHGVQLLPIRVQIQPGDSFAAVVERVRDATLEAREHYDFTFGALVRELGLGGDASRVPLMPVIFNIDQPFAALQFGAAAVTVRSVPRVAENFELFLNVVPDGGGLRFEATWNTDLFDEDALRAWLQALECLLCHAAADPTMAVTRIPLSRGVPAIYRQVNDTAAPLPAATWLVRLAAAVAKAPDAVAVCGGGHQLSYRELWDRARWLAAGLVRHGAGPGAVVGVHLRRTVDLPAVVAAVHMIGAAHLPLDPSYPAARLAWMIEDTGARLIVTDDQDAAGITPGADWVPLGTLVTATPIAELPRVEADATAYVIHTSGSTGRPKGVEVSHRNLCNFLDSMSARPGLQRGDRLIAVTTLSFDISLLELLLPLCCGATVVICTREQVDDGRRLAEVIEHERGTVMQATPSTWRMLLGSGWRGAAGLRAFSGGEALPGELAAALLPKVGELWNLYGPTETTVWSTIEQVREATPRIAIGRPIANTQVFVMDDDGNALPPWVPGELWIGGVGVASGYRGRPELTAQRFVEHGSFGRCYRTGDRAWLRADGRLEHLGRLDQQLKVRGFRIEPGEIETALLALPGVVEVAVVAAASREGVLAAFVVAAPEVQLDAGELRERLAGQLPRHMVPGLIHVPAALPRLPNGKLDRGALARTDLTLADERHHVAPRNDLERAIAEAMAAVLGVDRVSVADSFFAIGGHSLAAAQLAVRLWQQIGRDVSLRMLFEHPSPARLAAMLTATPAPAASTLPAIEARGEGVDAPLSLMQQRILFLERLEPGRTTFNTPSAHRLRGAIDETAFAAAFAELVRRQPVLRTRIAVEHVEWVQRVMPAAAADGLPVEDLRHLPAAHRESELQRRMQALVATPFDLDASPLWVARLYRLDASESVFFFMAHHIIWDGWSFDVLYAEMAALYDAFRHGRPSPLPPLPLGYGDFAAWHRRRIASREMERELAHWRQHLHGALEPLAVPADRTRPSRMSGRAGVVWVRLQPATVAPLRALAAALDTTLFTVLLTVFTHQMQRWSGQRGVTVGTPVRGRALPELESVMGLFVSALPVRIELPAGATLREAVAVTRTAVMDAFAYPDVPFELLVRALASGHDGHHFPIYQTMFSYQDGRQRVRRWGDLAHEMIPLLQEGIGEDIGLWLLDQSDGMVGGLCYNADILDHGSVELLARRLLDAFGAIGSTGAAERNLADLPLPAAETEVLARWNATAAPFDRTSTVDRWLAARVASRVDAIALRHGARHTTHRELHAAADAVAVALRHAGVGAGDRVGVCLGRGIEMVAALLGTWRAGAAYVPFEADLPEARLRVMIEEAGVRCVLVDGLGAAAMQPLPVRALDVAAAVAAHVQPGAPAAAAAAGTATAEMPAYVIFTSGSTGRPKAVAVPHRAIVNLLTAMAERPGLLPGTRFAAVTTVTFDIAVLELFLPMAAGAECVLVDRADVLDGRRLAELLAREGITAMQATPTGWEVLLRAGWRPADGFLGLVGGESLPPSLAADLCGRGVQLWNMYGPTETTVWSTCGRIEDPTVRIHIGRPIHNTAVHVLDAALRPCPIGVCGELFIGGDGVSLGYLSQPRLTDERFVTVPTADGPVRCYRTGDLGRWRADGMLEHHGRLDDQIKVRGHRVEPGEVEAALSGLPGVRECCVHKQRDSDGSERLVAHIVMSGGGDPEPLRAALRRLLPDYMIPGRFIAIPALPRFANGKVDRGALRSAPVPQPAAAAGRHVAPRTELEQSLAAVWQKVLGVPRVGLTDDFFALGGDSLAALRLVLEITAATGIHLEVGDLFASPTILELIGGLESGQQQNSVIVPLRDEDGGIPIFCLAGVSVYRPLAEHMPGQGIFSVHVAEERSFVAEAEYAGGPTTISIDRLADAYCAAIVRHRPRGPYRVAGLSFGGILAVEVAMRLRERGEAVDQVILFDTLLPHAVRKDWRKLRWFWVAGALWRRLARHAGRVRDAVAQWLPWLVGEDAADASRRRRVFDLTQLRLFEASKQWRPEGLAADFDVVLVRATDRRTWGPHTEVPPDHGWGRQLSREIAVIEAPGDHVTILQSPNVQIVCEALRRMASQRADRPGPPAT